MATRSWEWSLQETSRAANSLAGAGKEGQLVNNRSMMHSPR